MTYPLPLPYNPAAIAECIAALRSMRRSRDDSKIRSTAHQ
jgi:hypothetical protein